MHQWTLEIIEGLERELDKPVFGSNQALAWHLAVLSGTGAIVEGPGRLFRTSL